MYLKMASSVSFVQPAPIFVIVTDTVYYSFGKLSATLGRISMRWPDVRWVSSSDHTRTISQHVFTRHGDVSQGTNYNKNTFCGTRHLSHCCSLYRRGRWRSLKFMTRLWPCGYMHDVTGRVTKLYAFDFLTALSWNRHELEIRSFNHLGAIST